MRISSLFPAIVTAITAASFAITEPSPQIIGMPSDTDVARVVSHAPAGMLLAAFDPLALSPRSIDSNVR